MSTILGFPRVSAVPQLKEVIGARLGSVSNGTHSRRTHESVANNNLSLGIFEEREKHTVDNIIIDRVPIKRNEMQVHRLII